MGTSSHKAANDKVVSIHYKLSLDDGEIIDESGQEPLLYLHGHGNIVPGLEEQLEGKSAGDKVKAKVAPIDGYGERDPEGQKTIPRDAFPEDQELEEGMQFMAENPEGDVVALWIVEVSEDVVVVDENHPLSGETLHFDVEVLEVRDATAEELEHGHVHGPGDHHH